MRVYKSRSRLGGSSETAPKSTATDSEQNTGLAAWKRRHAAAQRVASLDCGCPDPWPCRCTEPPLSEHALDGWRDAAVKLLFGGNVPLLPIEVRRALWRRGGPDRVLAEKLHEACGGEIS